MCQDLIQTQKNEILKIFNLFDLLIYCATSRWETMEVPHNKNEKKS